MNTTDKTKEVLAILQGNRGRKGRSKFRADRTYVRTDVTPADVADVRLSPQAYTLAAAILCADEGKWNESEMFELVQKCSEDLNTRQEPWRIFQHYRKSLIESGILQMIDG